MPEYSDDAILALLGETLEPGERAVDPGALSRLHATLEGVKQETKPTRRRKRLGIRHPVAVALGGLVLSFSGVAAAAVGTDTLPGPTRNIAYNVGLPVTSPALYQTRGTLAQIQGEPVGPDGRRIGKQLQRELGGLTPGDLAAIRAQAKGALQRQGLGLPPDLAPPPGGAKAGGGTTDGGRSTPSVPSGGGPRPGLPSRPVNPPASVPVTGTSPTHPAPGGPNPPSKPTSPPNPKPIAGPPGGGPAAPGGKHGSGDAVSAGQGGVGSGPIRRGGPGPGSTQP